MHPVMSSRAILISLIFFGCAETQKPVPEPPAQRQLEEAQAESEQAYQRAQDAEQQARDKAAKANDAERAALKKQNEAQRAEAHARELRQEAEQAQREALREGQQAAREAQAAQQRALRVEPRAQAQEQAMGATSSTEGTVQRVSGNELVISRQNAPSLAVQLDPQSTTVTQDGRKAKAQDLSPGTPVIVTYRMERDQPIAESVETRGKPSGPATPL
ncbi:MAG: hypothetical protein ACM31C_18775 [Acidobacteriota bacterium]